MVKSHNFESPIWNKIKINLFFYQYCTVEFASVKASDFDAWEFDSLFRFVV